MNLKIVVFLKNNETVLNVEKKQLEQLNIKTSKPKSLLVRLRLFKQSLKK